MVLYSRGRIIQQSTLAQTAMSFYYLLFLFWYVRPADAQDGFGLQPSFDVFA